MGGPGSGRHSSFGFSVSKTSDYHAIDIAWLKRKTFLEPGRWSTLRWSRGGIETGSIRLECSGDSVRLAYKTRHGGEGDWKAVNDVVPIVTTATRFGGERKWFQCLSCNRRCRILYGGRKFSCRRCHGLRYETQYEPAFGRAATRALKLREKLGGGGGVEDLLPTKPKGMHWKTYELLIQEIQQLEAQWAHGIMRISRGKQ